MGWGCGVVRIIDQMNVFVVSFVGPFPTISRLRVRRTSAHAAFASLAKGVQLKRTLQGPRVRVRMLHARTT